MMKLVLKCDVSKTVNKCTFEDKTGFIMPDNLIYIVTSLGDTEAGQDYYYRATPYLAYTD